jgi:uncharacterized protein (DUF433 family)
MTEDHHPIPSVPIWVNPQRMSGDPCFDGTRLPIEALFTNLEGVSLNEFVEAFGANREQAVAVLRCAKNLVLAQATAIDATGKPEGSAPASTSFP